MKCIIGLGNIGKEYENTRHNMGFMCIDYLASKYNIKLDKKKIKCIYGESVISDKKVVLVKPTTYMNLSGEAVVEIMNWYKLELKDILVIYDDIDLLFGEVRYREKGSSGTHNGMKNIIQNIGKEDISRIRVGIENRESRQIPLDVYVLSKLTNDELQTVKSGNILSKVEESVDNFLTR